MEDIDREFKDLSNTMLMDFEPVADTAMEIYGIRVLFYRTTPAGTAEYRSVLMPWLTYDYLRATALRRDITHATDDDPAGAHTLATWSMSVDCPVQPLEGWKPLGARVARLAECPF